MLRSSNVLSSSCKSENQYLNNHLENQHRDFRRVPVFPYRGITDCPVQIKTIRQGHSKVTGFALVKQKH